MLAVEMLREKVWSTVPETLAELVLRRRSELGWKQQRLAEEAGISQSYVSGIERGINKKPEEPALRGLSRALRVPYSRLIEITGGVSDVERLGDPLTAYGEAIDARPYLYALQNTQGASAGLTRLTDVNAPGEDLSDISRWSVRAIKVRGDCMAPFLKDGDIALVLPPEAATDGNVVTATVDVVNVTCKRIRIPEGMPSFLEPANGDDMIMEGRFVVTGVVKHKISPL